MAELYRNSGLPPDMAAALFRSVADTLGGALDTLGPNFVPPALLDPNYVPPNRGPMVLGFAVGFLVLAVLLVSARFATRRWVVGRVGVDDWLMLPAVACLMGYTGVNVLAVHEGVGRHVYDITLKQISVVMKTTYIHTLIYIAEAFFVKQSILVFYLHLVSGPINIHKQKVLKAFMVLVTLYTIVAFSLCAFICTPARAYWDLNLRFTPACPDKIPYRRLIQGVFGVHVATDFTLLLLPIPMVLALKNVPTAKKFGLICLFGAGGVACVASILRLAAFPRLQDDIDISWNVVMVILWGQLEAALTIICACAPAIRPLFMRREKTVASFGGSVGAVRRTATTSGSSDEEEEKAPDGDLEAQVRVADVVTANTEMYYGDRQRRTSIVSTDTRDRVADGMTANAETYYGDGQRRASIVSTDTRDEDADGMMTNAEMYYGDRQRRASIVSTDIGLPMQMNHSPSSLPSPLSSLEGSVGERDLERQ